MKVWAVQMAEWVLCVALGAPSNQWQCSQSGGGCTPRVCNRPNTPAHSVSCTRYSPRSSSLVSDEMSRRAATPPPAPAARLACGFAIFALRSPLHAVAAGIDGAFEGYPRAELAVIMVLFPLTLNTAQAWIQDSYLRHSKGGIHGQHNGWSLLEREGEVRCWMWHRPRWRLLLFWNLSLCSVMLCEHRASWDG